MVSHRTWIQAQLRKGALPKVHNWKSDLFNFSLYIAVLPLASQLHPGMEKTPWRRFFLRGEEHEPIQLKNSETSWRKGSYTLILIPLRFEAMEIFQNQLGWPR